MANKKSSAALRAAEAPPLAVFTTTPHDELRISLRLLIVGTQPLIVHAWSEKARRELRDKHTKQPRAMREAKDPHAEFEAAKYRLADGTEGVPAHGLKGAFVDGARFVGGSKEVNMTVLKAALFVEPDCVITNMLRLYAPAAEMREDLVHVGSGMQQTVDLRYRPSYWPWFLVANVGFPSGMFTADQITDVVRAAGAFNGFCEWRPGSPKSKTGSYGTFKIGSDQEIKAFRQTYGVVV